MGRIKGSGVLNTVRVLRGQGKELARTLLPPHLHRYLEDRILVSSWYPEEEHLQLLLVLAQVLEGSLPEMTRAEILETMGRTAAQVDMSTLYAQVFEKRDPERAIRLGATVWRVYHDTGQLEVEAVGPGAIRVRLTGWDLRSPEFCQIQTAWNAEFVRQAGAEQVRVEETRCCCRGDGAHVWEIHWK